MCGFVGRINSKSAATGDRRPLRSALRFLKRRGPDSSNTWSSRAGTVELLHARLAIVDTDPRAEQPFPSADGQVCVVFNGEIYNYRELRAELHGYPFQTQSDTEVLIALYLQYGLAGLRRLRGMFSLCLVDARAQRVYLARDPIGKKPLFVARWLDGVYFGSSVVAMAAASNSQAQFNTDALTSYWKLGHPHPTESLVADCTPVLPGEILELEWSGVCTQRTSCVPEPLLTPHSERLEQVVSDIDSLLERAVQRRLTNNPHPVCLLSGGVDSTVVAAQLQRLGGADAITLGSLIPGELDERFARRAARRLNMPLRVVRVRPGKMADEVAWALDLQDEALGIMAFFPLALMVRRAKEYSRILLTGDGGDEVFLGYGKPSDWLAHDAPDVAGSAANDPYPTGSTPPWMSSWARGAVGCSLVGHMFTKLDRATAEQGVEARCPLLDYDLVQYARRLPPSLLFHGGRLKALLKDQLGGWPDAFVNRRKIGFAFRLRWIWALSGYAGLRDLVDRTAIAPFEEFLPPELRRPPSSWNALVITRNFSSVWRLLAWSQFAQRLSRARAPEAAAA